MSSSSLLCRVQAIYSFESDDPFSLRFEDGDFIDVFSKLPSGWWDGRCNGNRGWFPSNYVKTIEDFTASMTSQKRTSETVDSIEKTNGVDSKRASLPSNWTLETKTDGTPGYYYNLVTGEIRASYPDDDGTNYYEGESDEDSATSTLDSNCRLESSIIDNESSLKEQNGKWTQRMSAEHSLVCNSTSSQDHTWNTESQGSQGSLKTKLRSPQKATFSSRPSFDSQELLSWNKITSHITLCINNLIASTRNNQRSLYKKYAATIVDSVRFMLVASGTLNKDSTLIKTNTALRSHHRSMMSIMSKVVLAAQMNAENGVSNTSKLITDCHELLLTVQNFTKVCESIPVELHYTDPVLLSPQEEQNSQWGQIIRRQNSVSSGTGSIVERGGFTKYELQSDLIESLDVYGAGMQESIKSLMASLTLHDEDSRSSLAILLFTEYRNFGNQNGQFLSIIEDIDFQAVIHSPLLKQLAVAKQRLYDGLGQLFFKMQAMTDDSVPIEQVKLDMQESAWSVTNAIKLVCDCMTELVNERALIEEKRNQDISYVDQAQSPSLIGSTDSIKDRSLSDFLKDSSNHLSFDLSLPSPHAFNSMPSNGLDATKIVSSSSKTSNRSSAPVADHSNDSDDSLPKKNRAQTLTESQSKQTSAKLKQLFNDDLSDSNSLNTISNSPTERRQSQDEVYSFLQYDYPPNEIVFTSDGSVKGGTLRALVERMTLHDYLDMNFNNTFLLTYRSFCSSKELLDLLQARYNIQPPEDLTSEELDIWISKKQKLIRLRVFNVLKIWLEQYYYEEDSVILDRLLYFTNTNIKDTLSFSAHQLERLIQKRKEACKDLKKLVITHQVDSPDPILPRNLKKFRLLDLDTTEMARQLTIMDFKLYSSIKPVECLDKAWSKDNTAENGKGPIATNIKASIEYCNQITTWVSDEILSQSDVKKRSTIIKYWVNVAERCRILNNFNTCMAILSAFDNSAVGRLKRTWELVGSRCNHIVSQIRKLMGANRNFNYYRALIHSANPPCIPFLGIYLQDLTFIEDGNPNFLKTSKDLINFAKRAKTAEVIRELQQYQSMGYQFRMVDEVQSFIMDNLHSARDEDQLYRESLKLEPKERDDEKITRLLQESGFL